MALRRPRGHLRGQALLVIVDEIANDFHTGIIERCYVAAQDIEMSFRPCVGPEMHAWLNHGLSMSGGIEPRFNRRDDLSICQTKSFHFRSAKVFDINFHGGRLAVEPLLSDYAEHRTSRMRFTAAACDADRSTVMPHSTSIKRDRHATQNP